MTKAAVAKFSKYAPLLILTVAFALTYFLMERKCYPYQFAFAAATGAMLYAMAIYAVWRMAVIQWQDRKIRQESYSEKLTSWISGYWFFAVILVWLSVTAVSGFEKFSRASAPFVNCGERISQVPETPSRPYYATFGTWELGYDQLVSEIGSSFPVTVMPEKARVFSGLVSGFGPNTVIRYIGDLEIGSSGSSVPVGTGPTIVLIDGNVRISSDMVGDGASFWILAKGDVVIDRSVEKTVGIIRVYGTLYTWSSDKTLRHYGSVSAGRFDLQRYNKSLSEDFHTVNERQIPELLRPLYPEFNPIR